MWEPMASLEEMEIQTKQENVDPSNETMRILDFNEWYMATNTMDYDKFLGEPTLFTKGMGKLWSSLGNIANKRMQDNLLIPEL